MKKKLSLMLVFSASMLLSSCGDGGTSGGGDVPTNGSTTTLKVSFFNGGHQSKFFEALEKGFNAKYPESPIHFDLTPDPNLDTNIESYMQTKANLPDLVFTRGGSYSRWISRDYIEPLDDVMEEPVNDTGLKAKDSIYEGYAEACKSSVDGKFYTLPWAVNNYVFAYNKTAFDQFHWKVPETFDELITLCDEISKYSDSDHVYPLAICQDTADYYLAPQWEWEAQVNGLEFENSFYHSGTEVVKKNDFFSTGRQSAFDAISRLIVKGDQTPKYARPHAMSEEFHPSQNHLLDGTAMMMPCGSWLHNEFLSVLNDDSPEISAFPIPFLPNAKKGSDGKPIRIVADNAQERIFIPKGASNIKMAKKFLAYLNSDEGNIIFSNYSDACRPFKYDYTKATLASSYGMATMKAFFDADEVAVTALSGYFWEAGAAVPYYRPTQMISENADGNKAMDYVKSVVNDNHDNWVKQMQI